MSLLTLCESLICLDDSVFSKFVIFFIFVLGYQSANIFSYKDMNPNCIIQNNTDDFHNIDIDSKLIGNNDNIIQNDSFIYNERKQVFA